MRSTLIVFFVCVSAAAQAILAPIFSSPTSTSLVAATPATQSSGNTGITTASISTVGATFEVAVEAGAGGVNCGTSSFSDSQSNTWVPMTVTGSGAHETLWYAFAPMTAANQTFTTTCGFATIAAAAFRGPSVAIRSSLSNNSLSSSVSSCATGAITTAVNDLVVSGLNYSDTTVTTVSFGNGGGSPVSAIGHSSANYGGGLAWGLAVGVSTSETWTWTNNVGAGCTIASFY